MLFPCDPLSLFHQQRPKSLAQTLMPVTHPEARNIVPDAGTWSDLSRAQAQRSHKHAARAQYCTHPHRHPCVQAPDGRCLPQSTCVGEVAPPRYRAPGPRTTGTSPSPRSQYSPAAEAPLTLDEPCGGSHESTHATVRQIRRKKKHSRTPTSRNRTSRHSAPKSFMRLSASSRRLPELSQPLVTNGSGISLDVQLSVALVSVGMG